MDIKVKVDATEAIAGLDELQHRQLPFAMAKTLTTCVKTAQVAVQDDLSKKFTLRNNFTRQGIRIKPASKTGKDGIIAADVHTDTANRATGAPDYLLPQETGAEKVPHGGRNFIAVPTKYLRQMAPGVIPTELRPKQLLGAVGGRYTATKRGSRQLALRNQKIVRGFVFFVQDIRDGHKAIMGRYFTENEAYPFYLLIPEAKIKSRLAMERTVTEAVQKAFPDVWKETWRGIMVQGLKIKA